MIKLTKKHLWKPMIVTMDDHACGMLDLVRCRVIGWLAEYTGKKIVLCSWDVLSSDQDLRMANIETFSIIRSAITNIILLK